MKWLKHVTSSRRDEKLAALIAEHGVEVYGFYWMLVETIAESMDKSDKCELSYPLSEWSRYLHSHHNKVLKYFHLFSKEGLLEAYSDVTTPSGTHSTHWGNSEVTVKYLKGKIRVRIAKLLKHRDEWSKRSGVTPELLMSKEVDTQLQEEVQKPTPDADAKATATVAPSPEVAVTKKSRVKHQVNPTIAAWFDSEFWPLYWLRKNRESALWAANSKLANEADRKAAIEGLKAQLPEMLALKARDASKCPHGSTWINQRRWTDEVVSAPQSQAPLFTQQSQAAYKPYVDPFKGMQ